MKVCIYGAGQAGRMLSVWRVQGIEIAGYIDNNPAKQGQAMDGIPVMSQSEALCAGPDEIWTAVLNREAEQQIASSLRDAGYTGTIRRISDIRMCYDFRLSALRLYASEIKKRRIPGAIAELGVYRGDFAVEAAQLFPGRKLYLFDTFEGFDERDIAEEGPGGRSRAVTGDFSDTSMEYVAARLPDDGRIIFRKGYFPETAAGLEHERFAFVSLDPDLYKPALSGLRFFYPRLSPGGCIFIHDYNSMQYRGIADAVDEYCTANGLYVFPLNDMHGTGVLIKQGWGRLSEN